MALILRCARRNPKDEGRSFQGALARAAFRVNHLYFSAFRGRA